MPRFLMNKCVFCKSTAGPFTTREHILPESLGGGDWAILPPNLFCNSCQNRFGSEIEQQALGDYPFSFFRTFIGIPTKKGKPPWFDTWEGKLKATPDPGRIEYEPAPIFEKAWLNDQKTVMRILAEPRRPDMICRTLLKMGIEVIAATDTTNVFNRRYDMAREYALSGTKSGDWWYIQREDDSSATRMITEGITADEWKEGVYLEVSDSESPAETFHLKLLYLDFIVPLDQKTQPPIMDELPEPEYRLFSV